MPLLKLHRGIAVAPTKVDAVVNTLKAKGVDWNPNQVWKPFMWKKPSESLDLLDKGDLALTDTRPKTEWVSTRVAILVTIEKLRDIRVFALLIDWEQNTTLAYII